MKDLPSVQGTPLRSAAFVWACVTIGLVTAGVTVFANFSPIQRWATTLATIAFAPPTLAVICGIRRPNYLCAASILPACVLLGYLLPLSDFTEGRDVMSAFLGYQYVDKDAAIATALALATGAVLLFWLGYLIAPNRQARPIVAQIWRRDGVRTVIIAFVTIGTASFLGGVAVLGGPRALIASAADRLDAFRGINFLLFGVQLLPLAWLVGWLRRLSTGVSLWSWQLAIGGILSFSASLLLGTKLIVAIIVVTAVILYNSMRRRIRLRSLVVGTLLSIVGATTYDLYFREYLVNEGTLTSVVLEQLSASDIGQLLIARTLGTQFMQIQMLALMVDAVPETLPPQSGKTFLPVFTQLVPRRLWPDKPTTPAGLLTDALQPARLDQGTTFPPSFMGELYWNFRGLGVLFGFFVAGIVFRNADERINDPDLRQRVIGAFTIASLPILLRGDFSDTVTAWITFVLPILFALRVACTRPNAAFAANVRPTA